ncbi:MAG: GWxTD domain-containing protein [Ignavibacteria bacterium]|nr:GWxTD domain-containing protein [Ignavibacteria bacterium]
MKKILFLLLLCIVPAIAQTKEFKVDFDYARFHYTDSTSLFEIYYMFYQQLFTPVQSNGKMVIRGELNVMIRKLGSIDTAVNKKMQFVSPVNDSVHNTLVGSLAYALAPGKYVCKFTGRDISVADRMQVSDFEVTIPPVEKKRLTISDIEVSNKIVKSEDTASIFYKNTFEIVPYAACTFGTNLPVVYYYSELYNLDKLTEGGSEILKYECKLQNANNVVVANKTKVYSRKNGSVVDVGTFNVNKLPTGTYTLVFSLSDSLRKVKVMNSKKIYVYSPGVVDSLANITADEAYLASEFATYSQEECDECFRQCKYIATGGEISQWSTLKNLAAQRKFLFLFWNNRDDNKQTPENEAKNEYFQRVQDANSKYSSFRKPGWLSDRGRVLIKYGDPNEIERFPSTIDKKPYEIWHYDNLQGGVIFIFADLNGFSEYELIHSTAQSELRDENWERRVVPLNIKNSNDGY